MKTFNNDTLKKILCTAFKQEYGFAPRMNEIVIVASAVTAEAVLIKATVGTGTRMGVAYQFDAEFCDIFDRRMIAYHSCKLERKT